MITNDKVNTIARAYFLRCTTMKTLREIGDELGISIPVTSVYIKQAEEARLIYKKVEQIASQTVEIPESG